MRDVNPPGVGGRFLNISSCGGYSAQPTIAVYNAAKFGKQILQPHIYVFLDLTVDPLALEGFTESLSKEMDPSWNITATIIQLGGFRTEWGGSSLKIFPSPPQYTNPSSPCLQFRNAVFQGTGGLGDPAKAGKAMIAIADMPSVPLRFQFGTESMVIVTGKAKETLQNAEKYAEIAHSTNVDGVDKDAVMERFGMYISKQ